ncbi:MAG: P-II family nitrogen regulator [Synergistaceae bacterium]|nr:P-II family nitrogen regulator [Synergistaceae bacterium]
MKQIQAYIKSHKLGNVAMALQGIQGLRGMTVLNVRGFGKRGESERAYPVVDDLLDFAKHVKIEIFCNDNIADEIVAIIDHNARTGLRGDGKIYVSTVDMAFKVGGSKIS